MPTDRQRILQLAIESLEHKRRQIEEEINNLNAQLAIGRKPRAVAEEVIRPARKKPRFSKAERARRSARMKAYWEARRKAKKEKK